jgi:hypothetical protein
MTLLPMTMMPATLFLLLLLLFPPRVLPRMPTTQPVTPKRLGR